MLCLNDIKCIMFLRVLFNGSMIMVMVKPAMAVMIVTEEEAVRLKLSVFAFSCWQIVFAGNVK